MFKVNNKDSLMYVQFASYAQRFAIETGTADTLLKLEIWVDWWLDPLGRVSHSEFFFLVYKLHTTSHTTNRNM